MTDHLSTVRTLCAAAKLQPIDLALCGGQVIATVPTLTCVPETAIRRLYAAMGDGTPYSLGYNMHVEDGAESITFTPTARNT